MFKVTQRVIAEKAGVSANTVSRALNNKPDVKSKTKEKVLKIANKLSYTPNLLAKSLKSGKTKTIGVIVSNLYNPFFNQVLCGIDEILNGKEYNIIICNSNNDYNKEEKAIVTLIQKRVDGVLLTPVGKKSLDIAYMQKTKIPFVLVMSHLKTINTDYVGFDDKVGAFQATQHLIARGHRKILYLGGPSYFSLAQDRLYGHKKALVTHEIKVDQKLLKKIINPKMEEGYRIVKEILSKEFDFTAIATFNDYIAIGALKAILERNLKIPEDIAIIGYDDIEFASLSIVPLTTIQLPKYLLGRKAAELLLTKITGRKRKYQSIFLKPNLIVRNST